MPMDYHDLGLPDSLIDFVLEHGMIPFEDLALEIFREKLPEVPVFTLIPDDVEEPFFVIVRRYPGLGYWDGDPRLIDFGSLVVHVFARDTAADPNGEVKATVVSEAIRIAFHQASLERKEYPGLGSISQLKLLEEPVRKSDWATSSGPVQYADLPKGYWRYESLYQMRVRRPRNPKKN